MTTVCIVTYRESVDVLVCDPNDIRAELCRLHSPEAVAADEVATWRWTKFGGCVVQLERATWGSSGAEGLVQYRDVPEPVLIAVDAVETAMTLGKLSGELFFSEYGMVFDPDASDWDATAWDIDGESIEPSLRKALFPVYQAALVAGTRRLAGAS